MVWNPRHPVWGPMFVATGKTRLQPGAKREEMGSAPQVIYGKAHLVLARSNVNSEQGAI